MISPSAVRARDLQHRRAGVRLDHQRVVARRLEGVRESGEDARTPSCWIADSLPCITERARTIRPPKARPIAWCPRQTPSSGSERARAGEHRRRREMPAAPGLARSRGDHHPVRAPREQLLDADRVVAEDLDLARPARPDTARGCT